VYVAARFIIKKLVGPSNGPTLCHLWSDLSDHKWQSHSSRLVSLSQNGCRACLQSLGLHVLNSYHFLCIRGLEILGKIVSIVRVVQVKPLVGILKLELELGLDGVLIVDSVVGISIVDKVLVSFARPRLPATGSAEEHEHIKVSNGIHREGSEGL